MKKLIIISTAVFSLASCSLSYDGRTNQWIDKTTGIVVGCSEQEDEPIVPCNPLPGAQ